MNFVSVKLTTVSTRLGTGRWLLGVLPVLALGVLLAACGNSSSSSANPTTTPPTTAAGRSAATASGSAAFTKYTQCLTSHGVPAGTGVFGRRGAGAGGAGTGGTGSSGSTPTGPRPTIPAQYQKAFSDCASLRPTGGFGAGFGGGLNSAQAAAYRNCLQIHGVTLPSTPTTTAGQAPSTGASARGNGFAQFRNNPAFQAAAKACASLLPSRPGSTSTTTPAAGA
jgi:hypothetical protein